MSAPAFGEWLPIETAPKNGDDVLLYDKAFDPIFVGFYSMGKWCYADFFVTPTHWMPLPPPPKT